MDSAHRLSIRTHRKCNTVHSVARCAREREKSKRENVKAAKREDCREKWSECVREIKKKGQIWRNRKIYACIEILNVKICEFFIFIANRYFFSYSYSIWKLLVEVVQTFFYKKSHLGSIDYHVTFFLVYFLSCLFKELFKDCLEEFPKPVLVWIFS